MADNNLNRDNGINRSANNTSKPNSTVNNLAQKVGSAYLQKKGVPKGIADKAATSALNKRKTPLGRIGGALGGMVAGKLGGNANVDAEVPIEQQSTFGGFAKFWEILKDPMVLLTLGFLLFLGFLIMGIVIIVVIISGGGTGGGNTSGYSSIVGGSYCTNITIKGTSTTYTLEEYVARVVKAELGGAGPEGLKAQAILVRTFVLNNTSNGKCEIAGDTSKQAVNMNATIDQRYIDAAKATEGLVLTYNGKITNAYYASYPDGIVGSSDWGEGGCSAVKCSDDGTTCTTTLYKYPNKTAWEFTMPTSFGGQTYNLTNQTGHCHGASQLGILYYESLGEDYSKIIAHFFDTGVEISKLYTPGSEPTILVGEGQFKGNLYYYDQTDYSEYAFCGRTIYKKNLNYCNNNQNSICTSGCGATSTAIVMASLFQDKSIDPVVISNKFAASNGVACSAFSNGTNDAAYPYIAKDYNVYLKIVDKNNLSCVKAAFDRGDTLAIIGVSRGIFTSGGHIMAIVGYKDDQFYLLDPYGGDGSVSLRTNTYGNRTRNGYWDKNIILDQMGRYFRLFSKNSLDTISECQ